MWQFVTVKMFLRSSIIITNFSSRHIVLKAISSDQKLRFILAAVRAPSFPGGLQSFLERLGGSVCLGIQLTANQRSRLILVLLGELVTLCREILHVMSVFGFSS